MKLTVKKLINDEICHFAASGCLITSSYNVINIKEHGYSYHVQLPSDGWKSIFGLWRLSRRALRLDKCNVIPSKKGLIVIRQGKVYYYDKHRQLLTHVLNLKNCRNVLHQSIAAIDGEKFYFGEYGNNPYRSEVPVYRSLDGGRSWEIVFMFPTGKIRHIHGCCFDPIDRKIWIFTGDFENECHILCSDLEFKQIEWIGDGGQRYRACNAFFERDSVHWIMDSQLTDCYHIKFNRKTHTIEQKQLFPGPVLYIKRLADGYYLATTAQEIGPGVKDRYAHLMVSKDLEKWEDVYQFEHDGLPKRYFKFGLITFADGIQQSKAFYLFAEAVSGFDGKIALCEIR